MVYFVHHQTTPSCSRSLLALARYSQLMALFFKWKDYRIAIVRYKGYRSLPSIPLPPSWATIDSARWVREGKGVKEKFS